MKLKKSQIDLLLKTIGNSHVVFAEARLRDSIGKTLVELYEKFEEVRLTICKELATKNEAGEPVEKEGMYIFTDEARVTLKEKVGVLMDEEVDIPLKSVDAARLRRIVEVTEYKPEVGEVAMIEDILAKIK